MKLDSTILAVGLALVLLTGCDQTKSDATDLIGGAGDATAAEPVDNEANEDSATTTPANPNSPEKEGLSDLVNRLSLSEVVDVLASKLDVVDRVYVNSPRQTAAGLPVLIQGIAAEQTKNASAEAESAAALAAEIERQLTLLDEIAAQHDESLLTDLQAVKATEDEILKLLFVEGSIALQVKWDGFFAKADAVREQFVDDELTKLGTEMLEATTDFFIYGNGAMKPLIDQYIQQNKDLAEKNAPRFCAQTLRIINYYNSQLAALPEDATVARGAIAERIAQHEKRLKLPYDYIDSAYFNEIVKLKTALITAQETGKALAQIKTDMEAFGVEQTGKLKALSTGFGEILLAIHGFKGQQPAFPANLASIMPVLGATTGAVSAVGPSVNSVEQKLLGFVEAIKSGADEQKVTIARVKLEEAQGQLETQMDLLGQTLAGLTALYASPSGCSRGAPKPQGPIAISEINCGGKKFQVMTPAPAQVATQAAGE